MQRSHTQLIRLALLAGLPVALMLVAVLVTFGRFRARVPRAGAVPTHVEHAAFPDFEAAKADFATAADQLRVRLWPDAYFGAAPDSAVRSVVCRRDLAGVWSVLVLDNGRAITPVPRDWAAAWEQTPAELFRIALQNVRRTALPARRQFQGPGGVAFSLWMDPSVYTASLVLLLDGLPGCVGARGCLAAVPTRHELFAAALDDDDDMAHVATVMAQVAVYSHEQGPGSVSSRLYWYRGNGTFVALDTVGTGRDLRVELPAELHARPSPTP